MQDVLPADTRHYEAIELNTRNSYETWITASTRIGQGPSTPVIKLMPTLIVPAAIVNFGETFNVAWRVDVQLPCLFVGKPMPKADWKVLDTRSVTITVTYALIYF